MLRQRYTLSEWISKTVALKKKGKEYSGLCPFHQEKSPSFTVNDEKEFYHCFGCGAHGDIFEFVKQTEGKSYPETVRYLAEMAGVELPKDDDFSPHQHAQQQTLYTVCQAAHAWFQSQLETARGEEARTYIHQRGVSSELRARFEIGFAPSSRNNLKDALIAQGFEERKLIEAGLLISVDGKPSYDRFRNRLMFPIKDKQGRVIAFGGRTLDGHGAKYINSAESEIFNKSATLFGLDLASKPAFQMNMLVVVEGYMDVVALHKADIQSAVAPLGTAMTESHLHIAWRVVREPVVCFDGDAAGRKAAHSIALKALPLLRPGFSLQFTFLPEGEDPDSFLSSFGAGELRRFLTHPKPLSDIIWEYALQQFPSQTPEQQAHFRAEIMNLVSSIQDEGVRKAYRAFMEDKLWQRFGSSRFKKPFQKRANMMASNAADLALPEYSVLERVEKKILAFTLSYPELVAQNETIGEDFFSHIHFSVDSHQRLHQRMVDFMSHCERIDQDILQRHLEKEGFHTDIIELCGKRSAYVDHFFSQDEETLVILWACAMKQYYITHMQLERQAALEDASDDAAEKATWLHAQIVEYEHALAELKQRLELRTEV